jgi:hypothetical protein
MPPYDVRPDPPWPVFEAMMEDGGLELVDTVPFVDFSLRSLPWKLFHGPGGPSFDMWRRAAFSWMMVARPRDEAISDK